MDTAACLLISVAIRPRARLQRRGCSVAAEENLLVFYAGGTRMLLPHDLARKLTPDCASSLSPKVKAEILGNDHERRGNAAIKSLFGPDSNCDCDSGRNSFNRPFIFANWNNREATNLRAAPSRTKALRIKLPGAGTLTTGLCERLTGHLSIRREGHFEFNTTECGSGEGLAVEERRLDVAWSHGLGSEGCARVEE
jgi:hypothetical protein